MTDEFVCASCGEICSGEPYCVFSEVLVGHRKEWASQSLFARDYTYEVYCQKCANAIAMYITNRVGLARLNHGSRTNRKAKLDAERRMADIGRKMWMTDMNRG